MNSRVVIAGTQSGVGKTTLSIGLMAALTKQGYDVQPYKVGPDYIDPGFHTLVTSNQAWNLDSCFLGAEGCKEIFQYSAPGSDIAVIEGVMGLFDGKNAKQGQGSTAHIAKILDAPVVLVMDVKKMARSAAAVAYGYKNFDPDLNLAGVILNNVGSEGHYQLVKNSLAEVGVEVLGYVPYQSDLELPERHLGLVPTTESKELDDFIAQLVALIEENINLEQLLALSQPQSAVEVEERTIFKEEQDYDLTLGVAYDQAFNFYYQANLELLANKGVSLKYFSPLTDNQLPEVDGLYIGGGFPESFISQLAANQSLQEDIYEQVTAGLPTYAECGGLMYLSEQVIDSQGNSFPMVGLISGQVEMTDSLQAMGYVEAKVVKDNILFKTGDKVLGHEFHYSKLSNVDSDINYSYQLWGGKGAAGRSEGIMRDNLLASYLHLHFANQPRFVDRFLTECSKYQKGGVR